MKNTITDYDKNIILDCLYDYQKWFDKDESQYESIEEVINKLTKNQQTMSENHYQDIRKRKDIPLIIAVIYNENLLPGSVFQNFEEAYKLARAFHKKNKTDFNWEFEMIKAIIKFVNLKKGIY